MSDRNTHIRTQAVRHMVEARRRFYRTSNEVLNLYGPMASATRERLGKIEGLLRQGRDAEAILPGQRRCWCDLKHGAALSLSKANFNPDEPRDSRTKEWIKLEDGSYEAR